MSHDPHVERLPFPTRRLTIGQVRFEEYIIPDDRREEVLRLLYLFRPVPRLSAWREDIHTGRKFRVRDYRVLRHGGRNWLVSPFYEEGGGTVIDWIPTAPPRRARTP
jgi:hypothetical protein